jgi:hypothetical protein
MTTIRRYSEPYHATGGIAATGVLNQLGRPDIEPLEVLVREAIQNCWDARREDEQGIRVEIARRHLDEQEHLALAQQLLPEPPLGLPLSDVLKPGMEVLHIADFGTGGLGGPTRADNVIPEGPRDFVDFVRNIGQPPDKALGGGSYGFGKAALYLASRARTVLIDTLCEDSHGSFERRFVGCALGEQYHEGGQPYTGRHWWGRIVEEVPEPLVGSDAAAAAATLGLPTRSGPEGLGTTVVIVAPQVAVSDADGSDATMDFIGEALAWNFWPRMVATPGGVRRTMRFQLSDEGRPVRVPNPRTHSRLRGFVEAMDRLRDDPEGEQPADPFVVDRTIECLRPIRRLGRLVIQTGPTAPTLDIARAVPQGARLTSVGLHHVALMRNAELVVRYLSGAEPIAGRLGYSGAFRCAIDVDATFAQAEPPTHDDWVPAFLDGHDKTFVKVALDRIARICRDAAGYDADAIAADAAGDVPLGEFADQLAGLMATSDGFGARRADRGSNSSPRRRHKPGGRSVPPEIGDWVDGQSAHESGQATGDGSLRSEPQGEAPADREKSLPSPMVRSSGEPRLDITEDATAVVVYPFELRARGNRVALSATVEVMTNDGALVESEAPVGQSLPTVLRWNDPKGIRHDGPNVETSPDEADGPWEAIVPLGDDTMMRVNVVAEAL